MFQRDGSTKGLIKNSVELLQNSQDSAPLVAEIIINGCLVSPVLHGVVFRSRFYVLRWDVRRVRINIAQRIILKGLQAS